jgi:hypothetical protein
VTVLKNVVLRIGEKFSRFGEFVRRRKSQCVLQAAFLLAFAQTFLGWFSIDPVVHYFTGASLWSRDILLMSAAIAVTALIWLKKQSKVRFCVRILLLVFIVLDYFHLAFLYLPKLIVGRVDWNFVRAGLLDGFWISVACMSANIPISIAIQIVLRRRRRSAPAALE